MVVFPRDYNRRVEKDPRFGPDYCIRDISLLVVPRGSRLRGRCMVLVRESADRDQLRIPIIDVKFVFPLHSSRAGFGIHSLTHYTS